MQQIAFFNSLKMRFTIVFAFFIFISCGLITLLASLGILKTGESFAMERGIPICQRTVDYIDGDAFEKIANSLDENDPFYEETRLWMLSYKEMVGCKYLYTMAPVEGTNFIYIIDGSCDPSDEENFSSMGTEEDLSTWGPAVFDAVTNGGQKSSGLEKQEDWGWTISTYQAITNSAGKIVGFVGVDFDIGFLVETIKNEITRIGVFGIIFVLVGFFLVWVFTNSIFGTMKSISRSMEQIASGKGDLTDRIPEKGSNELSLLAKNCNLVIDSIERLVARLKKETGVLSETGNQLLSKMQENINQINFASEGIGDIDKRVTEQNGRLQKITSGVRGVENEIKGLDSRITEQSDAIRQSSAAVEEISANIKSVQRSVEFVITEYINLVKESENGRRMQESVAEQIAQIAQQSENLTEANSAITEIAEKTNMLAMNAAIEAAHAGDAGRGFGVVADEIRSLAETSATQSTAINELLVGIANAISEIVHSSEQSAKSFDSVGLKINQLDNLMKEVQGGMAEEGVGVESILDTMTTLKNTTTEITSASSQMKAQSSIVFTEIDELNQLAEMTHTKSTSVAGNVSEMKNAAESAVTASDRNCKAAKNVFDMISGFTVDSGSI